MRVLVSACLLGENCRYDGRAKPHAEVIKLKDHFECIPICPEQIGGLPTPRPPAERQGDCVINQVGADVSAFYFRGARKAYELCKRLNINAAILKEGSPSCGCHQIYDGSFSKRKTKGMGVTAELLESAGIYGFCKRR